MTAGAPVWDAVVVGAGPAGATTALHLARRGCQVLILEKRSWPRYKTCGGGLVRRTFRFLDVDIRGAIDVETRRAELHLHEGSTVVCFAVERPQSLVAMTMRSVLDSTLIEAAQRAGAELRTSSEVRGIEPQFDRLRLQTTGGSVHTRHLVVADGAGGNTARLAGWPPHRRLIPALESEIQVDGETRQRFSSAARFDFGIVPTGYAWVFPKRQRLSVGCLSHHPRPARLKQELDRYLHRLEIEPLERDDHGFVIPVIPRSRRLAMNRVLLTGDSAGLVDPVTCEGISNAILSGRLAATAIADHLAAPETAATVYRRSLDGSILKDLRFARILTILLYGMPRLRQAAFTGMGQALSETMVEIMEGEGSYAELFRRRARLLRAVLKMLGSITPYPKG